MQKVEVVDKRGNIRRCMHAVVGEGVIDKPAFPVRRRPLATSAMPCPVHHEFCPNKHQLLILPITLNNSPSLWKLTTNFTNNSVNHKSPIHVAYWNWNRIIFSAFAGCVLSSAQQHWPWPAWAFQARWNAPLPSPTPAGCHIISSPAISVAIAISINNSVTSLTISVTVIIRSTSTTIRRNKGTTD